MTGQSLERQHHNTLANTADDRQWELLFRQANLLAGGNLVPKALRGNPEGCMAVMLAAHAYGMRPSVLIFRQFDIMPDGPEPRAQVYAGMAARHGYDIEWVETTAKVATVRIRRGNRNWQTFSFTEEDARLAGRLDEWVEQWVDKGEKWPDSGKPKKSKETFVLGRDGVDVPDWAANEVRAGNTHRLDAWFLWRADLLAAKAIRRAVKRAAPEVMLGLDPIDDYLELEGEEVNEPQVFDAQPSVEAAGTEPTTSTVVDGRPEGPGAADPPPPRPQPETLATPDQIERIDMALAGLDDDGRAKLAAVLELPDKPGQRIVPPVHSPMFTGEHARIMLTELAFIEAQTAGETGEVIQEGS